AYRPALGARRRSARSDRGRARAPPDAPRRTMTRAFVRLNKRTFASLKYRNYRLFFSGQIVSITGTWMQNVAMAWLVLDLTGSPFAVGILALCQFLPFSVFGLFSGVITDRLDPRRLVIATQAASMALASVLAVLTLLGDITTWQVY